MTEQRYSDGTLARWYYSQTNVISDGNNEYYLRNKESIKDWRYKELLGTNDLLDELNKLSDENEELKNEIEKIAYANEDLLTEKRQWEKLSDEYAKLYKENEQLKKDCTILICHNQEYRKENDELKQQMQRLYNYFADWFDDRVPQNDFSEMWDFVKEDEKWD